MSGNRELGERMVAAATLKFKDFRVDFEKISNGAGRLMDRGEITLDERRAMFLDLDWDIRMPLQRRYAQAGAFDAIAKYHAVQFKNYMGRNSAWPDEGARAALDLFLEFGRPEIGVALIRTYADMQHKRLKRDYSKRNPRGPRKDLDEGVKKAIGALERAIAGAIPDRKRDLLRDLDAIAPYIEAHGGEDDRSWFEAVRREIWMERRA